MCNYCKYLRNSDDSEIVRLSETNIGKLKGRGMNLILGMIAYEHGDTGKYNLFAEFDVDGADLDAETSVEIHFCPMCGRKLN